MPETLQVRRNVLVYPTVALPLMVTEYGGAGGAMYNVHNHGTKNTQ